ncbi:XRE family transcriptional regulator [Rhodococcus aetherivorans]
MFADADADRLAGVRRIGIDEVSYKKGHKHLMVPGGHPTCRRSLRRSSEPTRREVRSMGISLEDMLAKRPVRRNSVEAHKARMLDQVCAYRLKEWRKAQHLTQKRVAQRLEVGQNRVSTIERGELDRIQLDALRRYVDAVGGTLRIEVELGDDRFQIA